MLNKPRTGALVLSIAVLGGTAVALSAAGSDIRESLLPSPTPAALVVRHAPPASEDPAQPSIVVPGADGIPSDGALSSGLRRVRLKENVLVHVAPNGDAPRPAISVLGAGQVATLTEQQGEWVLIEFGPLRGWTRRDKVEPVD